MGEGRHSLLKGCAATCGVLMLIVVGGLALIGVRTCVPLVGADRDLARLEERFGPADAYTPADDGAIPGERLQRFLAVRRALDATCDEFSAMLGQMERVETIGENDTPSGREVAGTTRGFAEVAAGIAPAVGRFFERRNRALLEAGLGLGEYSYVYAMAYRDQLLDPAFKHDLFSGGRTLPATAQHTLAAVLENQLHAARAQRAPADWVERLEREVDGLRNTGAHLPWSTGLPPPLAASLETSGDALDRGFCRATAGIELDRGARRALALALY